MEFDGVFRITIYLIWHVVASTWPGIGRASQRGRFVDPRPCREAGINFARFVVDCPLPEPTGLHWCVYCARFPGLDFGLRDKPVITPGHQAKGFI